MFVIDNLNFFSVSGKDSSLRTALTLVKKRELKYRLRHEMLPISPSEMINCTSDNITTSKGWPSRAGDSSSSDSENSTALLDQKAVSSV
ncbi:hypothetical protein AAHA92_09923 [Salvia divinorum]|uniref:Uncharacterized protein n=1 Tax=Salvia divinorum TaxID=28513 RepID=A0ABD1HWK3_SALDI